MNSTFSFVPVVENHNWPLGKAACVPYAFGQLDVLLPKCAYQTSNIKMCNISTSLAATSTSTATSTATAELCQRFEYRNICVIANEMIFRQSVSHFPIEMAPKMLPQHVAGDHLSKRHKNDKQKIIDKSK